MIDFYVKIISTLSILSLLVFPNHLYYVDAILPLCSQAQRWPLNGRDLVNDYRGNVLLLAFMPLDCPICESQLKKFEIMVEKLREIRIVVIAPQTEPQSNVQKSSVKFPSIRIVKETEKEPLWRWLDVSAHDHLVFDRCSRLAKIIRSPNSQADNFQETFSALKSVVYNAVCGHCKYDAQKLRNYFENILPTVTQISAYVVTQPSQNANAPDARGRQETMYQAQTAAPETTTRQQRTDPQQEQLRRQQELQQRQRYEEERRRRIEEERRRQQQTQAQQPQQTSYNTVYTHAPASGQLTPEETRRRQQNYADTRYTVQNDPRYQQQLEQDRRRQQQQVYEAQRNSYGSQSQNTRYKVYQDPRQATTTTRAPEMIIDRDMVEAVPLYPDGVKASDDDDYYLDYTEWVTPTPTPQQQIPKPTKPPGLWPTKFTSGMNYEMDKFGGLQLPCAGFTDEICYQQKLQLPDPEVHQCCKERLVFTDQCIPGRCSNVTNQLCCIHKFLQAKFSCCSDKQQGEFKKAGDHFSRCCYENFVKKEDECCSTLQAASHWKFVHELCLPNVEMDLSTVKVKSRVPGTSQATIDFDFGKTDKWHFECKYGKQVEQYSYYEDKPPFDAEREGDEAKR